MASQGQRKISSVKEGLRKSGTEGQVQKPSGKQKQKQKQSIAQITQDAVMCLTGHQEDTNLATDSTNFPLRRVFFCCYGDKCGVKLQVCKLHHHGAPKSKGLAKPKDVRSRGHRTGAEQSKKSSSFHTEASSRPSPPQVLLSLQI